MYANPTFVITRLRSNSFATPLGIAFALITSVGLAQLAPNAVDFHVAGPTQRLEMVVNTSRILTLDNEIPRVLVNNQDVLRVVPLSPTKVQVSALKPGVTQVNLWEKGGDVRSVDVVVFADARQLELVLQSEFPNAAIRVRPLASSVVLAGHVDRPEVVSRAVRIAEDYYPKVINNISVGGVQQVSLNVRVMEVSRTKLRALGADWAYFNGDDYVFQSVSGLINAAASGAAGVVGTGADTVQFGILNDGNAFFGFIEALQQKDFLKILAEPTLTTVSGRPASFNEGGEFPIPIPQGLGTTAIEFKQFGTRVDFVPIVLGNGNIRLEVRPEVSELDSSRAVNIGGVNVPGLRTRWVDTAVEMRAGQTLALAGLIQTRTESISRGLPFLADLPFTGGLFRRVRDETSEIELLVLVRPELVAALDPHQVPPIGPGESTTSPNDCDLLLRGYTEVPRCCPPARCPGPYAGEVAPMAPGHMPTPMDGAMMPVPAEGTPPVQMGPMQTPFGDPADGSSATPNMSSPEMFGPSGYDQLEF